MPSKSTSTSESTLDWFAHNPVVGLVGSLTSVTGLVLTLVFYFVSEKHREIVYQVSRSPTTIVQSGRSSDLRVYFHGSEVTGDVSSIQISIWNAGRESVRRENILSRVVTVKMRAGATILNARVTRTTRDLTGFTCQLPSLRSVSCSWDILENNDGGLLDIIYLGKLGFQTVDGEVEGRLPLREVSDFEHGRRSSKQPSILMSIASLLLGFAAAGYHIVRDQSRVGRREKLIVFVLVATIAGVWIIAMVVILFPHLFLPFSPFLL